MYSSCWCFNTLLDLSTESQNLLTFWCTPVNMFSEAVIQALLKRRISVEEYSNPSSLFAYLVLSQAATLLCCFLEWPSPAVFLSKDWLLSIYFLTARWSRWFFKLSSSAFLLSNVFLYYSTKRVLLSPAAPLIACSKKIIPLPNLPLLIAQIAIPHTNRPSKENSSSSTFTKHQWFVGNFSQCLHGMLEKSFPPFNTSTCNPGIT